MTIDAVARFGLILDPKLTACFNKENYIQFERCVKKIHDQYEFDFSSDNNTYSSVGLKSADTGINEKATKDIDLDMDKVQQFFCNQTIKV